jgi:hypothetical protein
MSCRVSYLYGTGTMTYVEDPAAGGSFFEEEDIYSNGTSARTVPVRPSALRHHQYFSLAPKRINTAAPRENDNDDDNNDNNNNNDNDDSSPVYHGPR